MADTRCSIHRYDERMTDWQWIIAMVAAYLLGSVPVGLLIGLAKGVDIRHHGSLNIGATNCGRVLGRRFGVLCFIIDFAKGAVPVFMAGCWFGWVRAFSATAADPLSAGEAWAWLGIALMPVLGHVFPIWLRFRGGKGMATTLGVLLGVWPFLTLPLVGTVATWLVVAAAFRYVSLASMIAAGMTPMYFLIASGVWDWSLDWSWPFVALTVAMALLIVTRHRSNVRRLRRGQEAKIGQPDP
ncbi:MAG: acyl-phosphate glycerol 3-phosphate acyltransferase [Planctomycetaceae bacterium]|nr:acyl-phosphate glycerol 3-phosphate acyltransferase [Planctomycetaceae bacterium]